MQWLSRLPVRVRLTLAFTGVMAIVLAATGLFLYVRLGDELDGTIEHGLRSRADDIAVLVRDGATGLSESDTSRLTEQGENLAQVLDSSGAIVDGSPTVRGTPLLDQRDLRRAQRGTIILNPDRVPGSDDTMRLLATPVSAGGRDLVVVVGSPLDDRNDALSNLAALLLLGGPIALLLASLAGYALAAAALRPVERMRAQAAAIQASAPGQRLSVPPSDDEISRLGLTLNDMLDRLEEGIERERRFVADASHELRTPLAVLKAELDLAAIPGRSEDELKAAVHSAAEETDRLVRLAEDLLVLARVERGNLAIRREQVAIGDTLERVRARFARQAADAGAELDAVPVPITASADPLRIEQALGNLVDNALRHGAGSVALSAVARDGLLELHVQDDGPGFPPEFIAEAFERFSRADPGRGRGGAGLGLAIVATIASAHGGSAAAANREGGGADVWISIPAEGV